MGTFVLKRKLYAEDSDKKSGMGLGTKLALGTAAVGGTFLGAKHGAFGNVGKIAAGKVQMGAGKMLGSRKIFKGGATTYARGFANEANKSLNTGLKGRELDTATLNVREKLMKNAPEVKPKKAPTPPANNTTTPPADNK